MRTKKNLAMLVITQNQILKSYIEYGDITSAIKMLDEFNKMWKKDIDTKKEKFSIENIESLTINELLKAYRKQAY